MSCFPEYQFLDLDDLNKEEADEIQNILYTPRPTRSVFPWIQEPNTDWSQQSNYDEGSEISGDGPVQNDVYQCVPPAVTTAMQQQVYPPQVVGPLQCFVQPYGTAAAAAAYYQEDRRAPRQTRTKPSPKRQQIPPQPVTFSHLQHYGPYVMSHQYQYLTAPGPAGMPSAQQAAGHPLFALAPAQLTTVYQPHPAPPPPPHAATMYPQYPPQVYSSMQHDRGGPPGSGKPMDQPDVIPPQIPAGPPGTVASATAVPPPQALAAVAQPQSPSVMQPPQSLGAAASVPQPPVIMPPQPAVIPPVPASSAPQIPTAPAVSVQPTSIVPQPILPSQLTPAQQHLPPQASDPESTGMQLPLLAPQTGPSSTVRPIIHVGPPQIVPTATVVAPAHRMVPTQAVVLKQAPLAVQQDDKKIPAPSDKTETLPVSSMPQQPSSTGVLSSFSPTPNMTTVAQQPQIPVQHQSQSDDLVNPLEKPVQTTTASQSNQQNASGPVHQGTSPTPQAAQNQTTPVLPAPTTTHHHHPNPSSAPLNAIKKTVMPSTMTWAGLFAKPSGAAPPSNSSGDVHSNQSSGSTSVSTVNQVSTSTEGSFSGNSSSPSVNSISNNPTPAESMTVKAKCKPPASALAIGPPFSTDKYRPAFHNAVPTQPHNSSVDDRRLAEMLSTYEVEVKATLLTPRGLSNPSNYCYINATLQALLACGPFYNLLKAIAKYRPGLGSNSSTYSKTGSGNQNATSSTPVIDSMIQFVNEFSPYSHWKMCRTEKAQARKADDLENISAGPSFEPHYVYKMLHTVSSFLQLEGRQEDAEEFLNVLLNGINDEMIGLLKLVKNTNLSNGEVTTNGETSHEVDSDWKEVTTRGMRVTRRAEFGRTPLTDIFMGQLRSRLQRSDPKLSTDNVQPFYALQLDIESCDSVMEALDKLVGKDAIEGGDSDTYQQQYLDHLPIILILHLKCFHYSGGRPTKISKCIDFPVNLKLDKYVTCKSKVPKMKNYKLFAVTYHEGKEVSKGHYLSDVYQLGYGGWLRYDDGIVKSVSEQAVLKPKPSRVPYLLYYKRVDASHPRHQQSSGSGGMSNSSSNSHNRS